jgi:hypothetical protein
MYSDPDVDSWSVHRRSGLNARAHTHTHTHTLTLRPTHAHAHTHTHTHRSQRARATLLGQPHGLAPLRRRRAAHFRPPARAMHERLLTPDYSLVPALPASSTPEYPQGVCVARPSAAPRGCRCCTAAERVRPSVQEPLSETLSSSNQVMRGNTQRATDSRRQHAARKTQHATRNMQHATCNTQHAKCNMRHATCDTQHATRNMLHATCNTQHATCNMQQTTGDM